MLDGIGLSTSYMQNHSYRFEARECEFMFDRKRGLRDSRKRSVNNHKNVSLTRGDKMLNKRCQIRPKEL
jgi:hypothetical protein